jgi:hypothetical protein
MQIELTPEIESALRVESSVSGLTPAEITLQALADYTRACRQARLSNEASHQDIFKLRSEAVERIIARSSAPDAPRLNLPDGMSIREWIHEGYKF